MCVSLEDYLAIALQMLESNPTLAIFSVGALERRNDLEAAAREKYIY